jgi:hypothetical protein
LYVQKSDSEIFRSAAEVIMNGVSKGVLYVWEAKHIYYYLVNKNQTYKKVARHLKAYTDVSEGQLNVTPRFSATNSSRVTNFWPGAT